MQGKAETDALVAGAGSAGLSIALAFARAGLRTICVDPVPRGATAIEAGRSVALLPESRAFLQSLGVWERIGSAAHPIAEFRFAEAGSRRTPVRFQAADIGAEALAWNVPNSALREAIDAEAAETALLERIQPARIRTLSRRRDGVFALLEDGRRIRAQLVVAADGRQSPTREGAGIRIRQWSHGRQAIAFVAASRRAVAGVCREFHGEGQTAALVPLQGDRVAVVWVLPGPVASSLLRQGQAECEASFNQFVGEEDPCLQIETQPRSWPESFLVARSLLAQRIALAGEAAHCLSPVGAQGLNLSLADAAALRLLAERAVSEGLDPGSERLLSAYARSRRRDNVLRIALVEAYALAASVPGRVPSRTRIGAARALERLPQLRKLLIQGALGCGRTEPATTPGLRRPATREFGARSSFGEFK